MSVAIYYHSYLLFFLEYSLKISPWKTKEYISGYIWGRETTENYSFNMWTEPISTEIMVEVFYFTYSWLHSLMLSLLARIGFWFTIYHPFLVSCSPLYPQHLEKDAELNVFWWLPYSYFISMFNYQWFTLVCKILTIKTNWWNEIIYIVIEDWPSKVSYKDPKGSSASAYCLRAGLVMNSNSNNSRISVVLFTNCFHMHFMQLHEVQKCRCCIFSSIIK